MILHWNLLNRKLMISVCLPSISLPDEMKSKENYEIFTHLYYDSG